MLTYVLLQMTQNKMITARIDNFMTAGSTTSLEPMIIASLKYPMNSKRMTSIRQKSKRKRL